MFQWAKGQNIEKVFMLPDGNGDFTRRMGMLVDRRQQGMGMRSWRYSMLVEDGLIRNCSPSRISATIRRPWAWKSPTPTRC